MKAAAKTDKGLVRPINEDSFLLFCNEGPALIAVADGMGGHKAGEVASAIAVETLEKMLAGESEPSLEKMKEAFRTANLSIYDAAKEKAAERGGMGTTMTALWCTEDQVLMAHVGDSRAYRLRGGELKQMSPDHSLVAEMVRAGIITPEEALIHPKRNVITRALGCFLSVETDLEAFDAQSGDIWLLCSDGLDKHVTDIEIAEVLSLPIDPEQKAGLLIEKALNGGGTDNITCIIWENEAEKA